MATFELTGPDGGTYQVDAANEHAALSAFSTLHGQQSSMAADVAKSAGAGLGEGAIGLAGMAGDIQGLAGKAGETDWLTRKMQEYLPNATKFLQDESARTASGGLGKALSSG